MSDTVWFGTNIREVDIELPYKSMIEYLYQRKKEQTPDEKLSGNSSSENAYQSTDLKDHPIFDKLKEHIYRNADELGKLFLLRTDKEQIISNMWCCINPKGASNRGHNHPGACFSGVVYLQCNEKSGDLNLTHPAVNQNYHFNDEMVNDWNNLNSGGYSLPPRVGTMVIFPAYQYHYVDPNLSEQDRIAIAFNTMLVDKELYDKFNTINKQKMN